MAKMLLEILVCRESNCNVLFVRKEFTSVILTVHVQP